MKVWTIGWPTCTCWYKLLIALSIALHLAFLCAIWTASQNSWKNPDERIMSILNFARQAVSINWSQTAFKDHLQRCNRSDRIAAWRLVWKWTFFTCWNIPNNCYLACFCGYCWRKEHFPLSLLLLKRMHLCRKISNRSTVHYKERKDMTKKLILGKKQLGDFIERHCRL